MQLQNQAVTKYAGAKATLLFRSSVYTNKHLIKLNSESDYALVWEC